MLDGEIHSKKEVNIGKNGQVKGVINTQRLVVQGTVEGTINADRVEIKAAGHVKGEISSLELVIESRGIFEGNSIVKDSKDSKKKISADLSKS